MFLLEGHKKTRLQRRRRKNTPILPLLIGMCRGKLVSVEPEAGLGMSRKHRSVPDLWGKCFRALLSKEGGQLEAKVYRGSEEGYS